MGLVVLPPELERELGALRKDYALEVIEEPEVINVIISEFPTGQLYSSPSTTLLLRVPRAYPEAGQDMFWTDTSLVLATGALPQAGETIETYAGREWRRFSWHHNGWHGRMQSTPAYLDFVRKRFNAA